VHLGLTYCMHHVHGHTHVHCSIVPVQRVRDWACTALFWNRCVCVCRSASRSLALSKAASTRATSTCVHSVSFPPASTRVTSTHLHPCRLRPAWTAARTTSAHTSPCHFPLPPPLSPPPVSTFAASTHATTLPPIAPHPLHLHPRCLHHVFDSAGGISLLCGDSAGQLWMPTVTVMVTTTDAHSRR
jgi:hypothetical protein